MRDRESKKNCPNVYPVLQPRAQVAQFTPEVGVTARNRKNESQ